MKAMVGLNDVGSCRSRCVDRSGCAQFGWPGWWDDGRMSGPAINISTALCAIGFWLCLKCRLTRTTLVLASRPGGFPPVHKPVSTPFVIPSSICAWAADARPLLRGFEDGRGRGNGSANWGRQRYLEFDAAGSGCPTECPLVNVEIASWRRRVRRVKSK